MRDKQPEVIRPPDHLANSQQTNAKEIACAVVTDSRSGAQVDVEVRERNARGGFIERARVVECDQERARDGIDWAPAPQFAGCGTPEQLKPLTEKL